MRYFISCFGKIYNGNHVHSGSSKHSVCNLSAAVVNGLGDERCRRVGKCWKTDKQMTMLLTSQK